MKLLKDWKTIEKKSNFRGVKARFEVVKTLSFVLDIKYIPRETKLMWSTKVSGIVTLPHLFVFVGVGPVF